MKATKRKPLWGLWCVAMQLWREDAVFRTKASAKLMCCYGYIVRRIGWYDPEPLKEKK